MLQANHKDLIALEVDPGAHLLGAFAGAAFVLLVRARPIPQRLQT